MRPFTRFESHPELWHGDGGATPTGSVAVLGAPEADRFIRLGESEGLGDVHAMTRRISLHLYLTLDGYNEFPTYPGSDHPYPDEPELVAEEMWVKRWGAIDSLLFDSVTYEQWADFWPMAKRTPGEHPWFRQMSEFAERAQKIVFSDTPGKSSWGNTRFIEGDLHHAVNRLKAEGGGNMAVVSPELGMELTRRGFIDDYFLLIFPVILGQGRRFFEALKTQQTLGLVEVKSFQYGEIFLHYQAIR